MKRMPPRCEILHVLVVVAVLAGGFLSERADAAATMEKRSANDDAEIRAVMSAQVSAWNRGDIDGFMNGYARSDATEFVSGDKLTRGWQTVRDRYQKKYDSREKMGTLTFSELKITTLGSDAALVIGCRKLARKKDKPHGCFTCCSARRPPAGALCTIILRSQRHGDASQRVSSRGAQTPRDLSTAMYACR